MESKNRNYNDVKYDEVIDKYGEVNDLGFAKHLIALMWDNPQAKHKNPFTCTDEFLERCENELAYIGGGFTLKSGEVRDGVETYSLGGPGGWSGLIFTDMELYAKSNTENYGVEDTEDVLNTNPTVHAYLDGKLRTFLVTELD